ncbi:MAG: 1-phosphofructokinase [Oscillospiraceae bacterium]
MIYTITFNPAIDYVVRLDSFSAGKINRTASEGIFFGGKGLNVSQLLNTLGIKSTAMGFSAGFTGKAIEDGIRAQGIAVDFVHLESGNSRINVKVKAKEETEINGQGPAIPDEAVEELFAKLDRLASGDMLVLAGSVPGSLPGDIYEQIIKRLDGRGIRIVVDAAKELLLNTLKYNPFLVKPNNFELGEMFGVTLSSDEEIISYAKKLREMGAVNVLVSMAGDGSILVDEKGDVHKMGVCSGEVVNSVGAGDSMVAGFIAGYTETGDYNYALKLGTACGGATAFSSGLAEKPFIDKLLETL